MWNVLRGRFKCLGTAQPPGRAHGAPQMCLALSKEKEGETPPPIAQVRTWPGSRSTSPESRPVRGEELFRVHYLLPPLGKKERQNLGQRARQRNSLRPMNPSPSHPQYHLLASLIDGAPVFSFPVAMFNLLMSSSHDFVLTST